MTRRATTAPPKLGPNDQVIDRSLALGLLPRREVLILRGNLHRKAKAFGILHRRLCVRVRLHRVPLCNRGVVGEYRRLILPLRLRTLRLLHSADDAKAHQKLHVTIVELIEVTQLDRRREGLQERPGVRTPPKPGTPVK